MAKRLDAYYAETGSLQPRPNADYNGRTLGVWVLDEDGGTGMVKRGNLVLQSKVDNYAASTRVIPWVVGEANFEFDARATGRSELAVQWKSRAQDSYDPATRQEVLQLGRDWQTYRVPMTFKATLNGMRLILPKAGSAVEIRNARVLTKTGTQMMGYQFH